MKSFGFGRVLAKLINDRLLLPLPDTGPGRMRL
jgi:hypothetical protein